jgi:glycosyltransferase involved in cell wall biosynthesis
MDDRIKILFHNRDAAGVNYFRTNTPAVQLERDHSDKFHVEINSDLDFTKPETIEYLKSFHVIHYHRQLVSGIQNAIQLKNVLSEAGVTLVMDIDDYWHLDKTHPFYRASRDQKLYEEIIDNLKLADFVTTTTDLFASEIRKITKKDNVKVYPNSIDPTWMKQFQDNRKPDPDGRVRITYMAGSSHMNDVQQLIGVANRLQADLQTKDKFKVIIAGWDTEGTTTDVRFNTDFRDELQKRRLWDSKMVKAINRSGGNIDLIPNIPADIIEKFRDNVFIQNKRAINSEESVYLEYEKILTDNHRIIGNNDYIEWLGKYERGTYAEEENFARRWTRKANVYAEVLNETDISIAPLADNMFNRMKSNLKQVECWSRKLPIVCSDIPPYNVDGVDGENCLLIPVKKNADKYWFKALKKLILDEELRNSLGQGLYDTFGEKYNLKNVTAKRADFYESIIHEALKV